MYLENKNFQLLWFIVVFVFSVVMAQGSLLDNLLGTTTTTTTPAPPTIPKLCNLRSSPPPSPTNNLPLCVLLVEDITSGRPLHGTNIQSSPKPYWFNSTLASIGQTFALKNKFSITIGALSGLLVGLPFPDARDVLSFTRSSDTSDKSAHRYLATATQLYVWLDEILNTQLNDIFFTSVANVRAMHLDVVRRINSTLTTPFNDPAKYSNVTTDEVMWTAVAQDIASSPLTLRDYSTNYTQYDSTDVPINQLIQGLTLFAFAGYAVIDPNIVLIHDATNEELTGWIHLWAIVGYVMGVHDDYNIMLQPDVATARQYFNDINAKYVIPCHFKIEKVGKVLLESMLNAVNQLVPTMGIRPVMYRLLRDYFKIPAPAMLALIQSQLTDSTSQLTWDTIIAPSTSIADERLVLNTGLTTDIQTLIIQYFGFYLTNEDKANHVYYPGLPA